MADARECQLAEAFEPTMGRWRVITAMSDDDAKLLASYLAGAVKSDTWDRAIAYVNAYGDRRTDRLRTPDARQQS